MYKSAILVTFMTALMGLSGLLIQLLIAKNFGVGLSFDSLTYCLSLPLLLTGILSSYSSYVITPIILKEKDSYIRNTLISEFIYKSLFACILVILTTPFLTYIQLHYILIPSNDILNFQDTRLMIICYWIFFAFQIVLAAMVSILNGMGRHFTPTILAICQPLIVIVIFLLFKSKGISIFSIGAALGSFACVLLGIYFLFNNLVSIRFHSKPISWETIKYSILIVMGVNSFSIFSVIDAHYAPLAGIGILSTLSLSQRVIISIGNLAVIGPYNVFINPIVAYWFDGDNEKFKEKLLESVLIIALIAIFFIGLIFSFSIRIASFLLSVKSSNGLDVLLLSNSLRYMVPGMIGMVMSAFILKLYIYLNRDSYLPVAVGFFWTTVYLMTVSFFYKFGIVAFSLSYSVLWNIVMLYLLYKIFSMNCVKLDCRNSGD
jgi:putative peptidoglycan lipid II flippase